MTSELSNQSQTPQMLSGGGFPCQDISVAGDKLESKGTRSGLFYELMRVVRTVRPRYIVLESVAAIVSNGLDIVLDRHFRGRV